MKNYEKIAHSVGIGYIAFAIPFVASLAWQAVTFENDCCGRYDRFTPMVLTFLISFLFMVIVLTVYWSNHVAIKNWLNK